MDNINLYLGKNTNGMYNCYCIYGMFISRTGFNFIYVINYIIVAVSAFISIQCVMQIFYCNLIKKDYIDIASVVLC